MYLKLKLKAGSLDPINLHKNAMHFDLALTLHKVLILFVGVWLEGKTSFLTLTGRIETVSQAT